MSPLALALLATSVTPPSAAVPDAGTSGLLLGLGVVSLGVVARLLKNRKR